MKEQTPVEREREREMSYEKTVFSVCFTVLPRAGEFMEWWLTEFFRSRYLVFLVTGIPDRKAKMSLFACKSHTYGWVPSIHKDTMAMHKGRQVPIVLCQHNSQLMRFFPYHLLSFLSLFLFQFPPSLISIPDFESHSLLALQPWKLGSLTTFLQWHFSAAVSISQVQFQ